MVVASSIIEQKLTDFPTEISDQLLIQRLQRRDLSALEALINRHRSVAIGHACRVVRDRSLAEDVVQDAFLTIWRQPERYDPTRGSVRCWLLAIVHYRSIDKVRRLTAAGKLVELTTDIIDEAAADPGELAILAVERERVHAALGLLPADQRRAIELSFLQGRTHSEIAELMNCPLGTVKGRIRIGLEKLRTMIQSPDLVAA
jgi:RNA polymerase sigma-70 factor (ECF subfamily)